MSTREQLISWLQAYRGLQEGVGNRTPFAAMSGLLPDGQPWCAKFLNAGLIASATPIPEGARSAFTPTMYAGWKRAGLAVPTPERGDLGFVYYADLGRIGHTFLVLDVDERRDVVRTIEGNTNQAASPSGGMVAELTRDYRSRGGRAYVYGFVRPQHDGVALAALPNLPVVATHTNALVLPAALILPTASSDLVVDGELGRVTIERWQRVMGTTPDGVISDTGERGSELVRAVQELLNAQGAGLVVDGKGIRQDGRKYETVRALQGYLGSPRDGRLDTPKSEAVKALQRRLNAGSFRPRTA